MVWRSLAPLYAALCLGIVPAVAHDHEVTIALAVDEDGAPAFEVRGLSPEQVARASRFGATDKPWTCLMTVTVGSADAPPMLGSYSLVEGRVRFEPRFPLDAGKTYVAVLHVGLLTGDDESTVVRREFQIAAEPHPEATALVQVFPTGDVLPENLLKLYLHFSGPMSRGDSYHHLRLLDARGHEIDLPFLEIGEELWNDAGTRLTVLFDPGRIKRGVKPREDVGPVLEEGKSYTLVIDPEWPDADGWPLDAEFRRTFQVGPPDARQPDPRRWTLVAPTVGSEADLVVEFDEPLDHAMLHRVLSVTREDGGSVRGRIRVDREETRWRFGPEDPWSAGRYRLDVETTLEDLAGNSIGRPFEVDAFDTIERATAPKVESIHFAPVSGPSGR